MINGCCAKSRWTGAAELENGLNVAALDTLTSTASADRFCCGWRDVFCYPCRRGIFFASSPKTTGVCETAAAGNERSVSEYSASRSAIRGRPAGKISGRPRRAPPVPGPFSVSRSPLTIGNCRICRHTFFLIVLCLLGDGFGSFAHRCQLLRIDEAS